MLIKVQEYVPVALPEGWDEARLADMVSERLRQFAAQQALELVGVAAEVDRIPMAYAGLDLVPVRPGQDPVAHLITWQQDTKPLPPPLMWEPVTATAAGDGTARVDTEGRTRLSVTHEFGTMRISVVCYDHGGVMVPPQAIVPITDDEVELTVSPGTARIVLAPIVEEEG